MTYTEFTATIQHSGDEVNDPILRALRLDAQGDWSAAHQIIDGMPGDDAAWVHAYLHRKEGDMWNADYWYRQAARTRPQSSLQEEWESLVRYFTT